MESLASIRKACKVPKVQRLTAAEAHQRVRAAPNTVPKTTPAPPEGQHSDLWWGFYHDALQRHHPDPEKMADSALRARERALALKEARHKVMLTLEPPKPSETVAVNKGTKKAKPVVHDSLRCKALTLEGRRCGFKATCGDFCKKHAVEKI
jgi:hypothetical protein